MKTYITLIILAFAINIKAQKVGTITGVVKNMNDEILTNVTVLLKEKKQRHID